MTPTEAPRTSTDASATLRRAERVARLAERLAATAPDAPPRAPETPEAVAPYRRPLSASSLKLFVECERKWYFRYLCNAIDDPGSIAGAYGTAFHDALERLHQRYDRPDASIEAELREALATLLREAFERQGDALGSALERELHLRRALRTGRRYVSWIVACARTEPFAVVGNETRATLKIDGHAFTGFIDRLDRDDRDGSIVVVDYKTGSIAQTAAEYRDDVAALREFQLPLYYWSRVERGETVRALRLIPLKDERRDVEPVEVAIVPGVGAPGGRGPRGTIGVYELERARARMGELAASLTGEATPERFAAAEDPAACAYCAYVDACRARPRDAADPFGR